MGDRTTAEYEILDGGNRPSSVTGVGRADSGGATDSTSVEHNERLGPDWQTFGPAERRGNSATGEDGQRPMTQPGIPSPASAPIAGEHELDAFLGKAFEEKPIWTGLYESIRDVFFPPKLPPLELTSTPIPVPDRMAFKTNPWAVGTAAVVNGLILALILFLGARAVIKHFQPPMVTTPIDVGNFDLKAPKKAISAGGGGGGGDHSLIDPTKGKNPKFDKAPQAPPMVPILDKPKLAVDSAVAVQQDIKLPDNPLLPTIGLHNAPNVTMSNGQGSGGGMGTGSGGVKYHFQPLEYKQK